MYIVNLAFENYLPEIPDYLRFAYSRFRCRNNNIPVERGAMENIPTYCKDGSISDEFHYLMQCKHFFNHLSAEKRSYKPWRLKGYF